VSTIEDKPYSLLKIIALLAEDADKTNEGKAIPKVRQAVQAVKLGVLPATYTYTYERTEHHPIYDLELPLDLETRCIRADKKPLTRKELDDFINDLKKSEEKFTKNMEHSKREDNRYLSILQKSLTAAIERDPYDREVFRSISIMKSDMQIWAASIEAGLPDVLSPDEPEKKTSPFWKNIALRRAKTFTKEYLEANGIEPFYSEIIDHLDAFIWNAGYRVKNERASADYIRRTILNGSGITDRQPNGK
jgi:arsenate reductase-like glutaredoxin family protein